MNQQLKSKKLPAKEFEKRMVQLQNAFIDETYTKAGTALVTSKADHQYKVAFCAAVVFTLVINDGLDFVVFSNPAHETVYLVPAKKMREVIPAHCFFDEYSFYIDNACVAAWDSILEKAKAFHETIN